MVNVPARYVPKGLSKKDRKIQKRELKKSRKMYKGKKYYTRKKVKSFKSKVSPHILKVDLGQIKRVIHGDMLEWLAQ